MFRWILGLLLVTALGVGGVVAWRTKNFTPLALPEMAAPKDAPAVTVDAEAAAKRLAEAIRFQTVSTQSGQPEDPKAFDDFHAWLAKTYPAIWAAAPPETVGAKTLLMTWTGSDPSLPPLLLLAHQDVVPVEDWSRKDWKADPFGGEIIDGKVWGRGAVDDKGSLISILEAANALATGGFKPARTVIFAFGHDEEVSGSGAAAVAALLKTRGVKAWFALDEGMAVIENNPLTGTPVGLIGVSEKGYATMRIVATGVAGHSSTPASDTAVTLLAEAVLRIHRMPVTMKLEGGPAGDMIRALAPSLPLATRVAAANEWLFSPVINHQIGANPRAAALLRTTIAPTMLEGGPKENVIPGRAVAMINFRLHPRDTKDSIMALAQDAVRDLPGVSLEWAGSASNASPVSSTTSDSYALLASVAREVGNGAPVAPTLVLGATDARHYAGVAENVYRFTPAFLSDPEIAGVHGVNEHVTVANVGRMVKGFTRILVVGAGPGTATGAEGKKE